MDLYNFSKNNKFIFQIEKLLKGKHAFLKASIFLFLIAIITSFPDPKIILSNVNTPIDWQIDHPFSSIDIFLGQSADDTENMQVSHIKKLMYRQSLPLLCSVFGINTPLLFWIQLMAIFGSIFMLLGIFNQMLNDKTKAFYLTGALVFTFTIKWGLNDMYLSYDGIAFFFIIASLYFRNYFLYILFSILSLGCDERAVLSCSIVVFIKYAIERKDKNYLHLFRLLLPFFAWLAMRYYLTIFHGFSQDVSKINFETLIYNFKNIPLGILFTFESLWYIIAVAFYTFYSNKEYMKSALLASIILFSSIGAFMVYDVSRSLAYLFPILIYSVLELSNKNKEILSHKLLFRILILNFLIATHGVFVDGVYWMSPVFPKILKFLS